MNARMVVLRAALIATAISCLAQTAQASAAALEPVYNGATMLGIGSALAAVATLRQTREVVDALTGRVCLDCLDGRHAACEGCRCAHETHEAVRHGA